MKHVDVAINVLGKPNQTAVALLSLLEQSEEHINNIHITLERDQPADADFSKLLRHLGDRAVAYRPWFNLGVRPQRRRWLMHWKPYRQAIRYQRAWEVINMPYLFVLHNDMRFHGDLLGAMLDRIEGNIAIGPVGQCWNCPASTARLCGSDLYAHYRPTYAEWKELARTHPGPRADHYGGVVDPAQPWPLPECRINEWSMLVNMELARPSTMPFGSAVPLGALYGLDIGTQWFHDVLNAGQRVQHFDIAPYATHAWASRTGGGHAAMRDHALYQEQEKRARVVLFEAYPDYAQEAFVA